MSRQTSARNLSLTEELERLEQSITLTLQEIDSNFSKAHRIVTTTILPIVEQYAQHSDAVWEASKFWKQFFEASANVSLSGYEENAANEDDLTHTDLTSAELEIPTDHGEDLEGSAEQRQKESREEEDDDDEEEFTIDSPTQVTGLQTTPKLPSTAKKPNGKASATAFTSPSPRKYTGSNPRARNADQPSTPRPQSNAGGAQSSPFQPESAYQPSAQLPRPNNDPLMHRVLDKTYRVQATPHTQRREKKKHEATSSAAGASKPTGPTRQRQPWDSSPQSSPEIAAPQLRSDLFSPAKLQMLPRTPGISVLTPARDTTAGTNGPTNPSMPTTSTGRPLFPPNSTKQSQTATAATRLSNHIFSSPDSGQASSDEDELSELSPPKTLQFHVPTSRLLQTPAREASKKIVEDLLLTAGAEPTDEIEGIDDPSLVDEPSPSLVRARDDGDMSF